MKFLMKMSRGNYQSFSSDCVNSAVPTLAANCKIKYYCSYYTRLALEISFIRSKIYSFGSLFESSFLGNQLIKMQNLVS